MCLTKHPYEPTGNDWDKDILECCGTDPDNPGCVECCYDDWQTELKIVVQDYNQTVEDANQKQNKWNIIYARRNTYKSWVSELDKAEELAEDICNQLEIIALQSDKIWHNACKAVDAIEILFCMLRDFFMQLDNLILIYGDLQTCISKNNDSALVKGQGILKYLDDYKQKLDAVLKSRDDIIKSITDAIKLSNLIANYITTRDCCADDNCYDPCADNQKPCAGYGKNGEKYYGFKTVICEWYNAFGCDVPCEDNNQQNQGNQTQQQHQHMNYQEDKNENECDDNKDCELTPTFDFPICKNNYKNCVEQWLEDDEAELKQLTKDLQNAKKKKESLSACKTNLENAIKAVDPKERCK